MAARDPETGQFTAGAGGLDMAFDDLDAQHIFSMADVRSAQGPDSRVFVEPWQSFEPLGGLGRQEVAELVAVVKQAEFHVLGGGTTAATTETSMTSALSFDSTVPFQGLAETATERTEQDVEGSSGLDRFDAQVVDIDILDYYWMTAQDSTISAADSAGMGRWGDSTQYARHYRSWFGRGPEVDRHDELFIHWGYHMDNLDADLRWRDWTALYWDVREEE